MTRYLALTLAAAALLGLSACSDEPVLCHDAGARAQYEAEYGILETGIHMDAVCDR